MTSVSIVPMRAYDKLHPRLRYLFGPGYPRSVEGASLAPVCRAALVALSMAVLAAIAMLGSGCDARMTPDAIQGEDASAALAITTAVSRRVTWPDTVTVSGPILPWQEAVIGAPLNGLRLASVEADVGDIVVKGQVLARFDDALLKAEVNRLHAALAQAQALARQARRDAQRAEQLRSSGALSEQSILAASTQADVADAAVRSARAALEAKQVELSYTVLRASDNGVVSARTATVGAVADAGEGLFRLIRRHRLEWRGEVSAHRLAGIGKGQPVNLVLPDGSKAVAIVRQVAPTLSETARTAWVYADVREPGHARAGMYAVGKIQLGQSPAVVVPASAVIVQDGGSHVFLVQRRGAVARVSSVRVVTGRKEGPDVEIVEGVGVGAEVALDGAGFLSDGERVRVASAPAGAAAQQTAPQP